MPQSEAPCAVPQPSPGKDPPDSCAETASAAAGRQQAAHAAWVAAFKTALAAEQAQLERDVLLQAEVMPARFSRHRRQQPAIRLDLDTDEDV